MPGKLYGIGVGPGEPELLTLKAFRLIKEADVLALPGKNPKETVAYQIVKGIYEEIDEKPLLALPMPMTKDRESLEKAHNEGAALIGNELDQNKNVVFLTLGDPTVYSTYLYVHKRINAMGYDTEIVSGIPSFCAVAAKLNIGLVEKAEPLHVIPASYEIEDIIKLSGTKVLMKAGGQMKKVKEELITAGKEGMMIENCGMPNEKIYRSLQEIPDDAGYYSLIIIKDKGE